MKKIIGVFFLLICAAALFLATVDLRPYLTPQKTSSTTAAPVAKAPASDAGKAYNSEQLQHGTGPSHQETTNGNAADTTDLEMYPEQEQVVMAPPARTRVLKKEQQPPAGPGPVELEVNVLPPGDYPFSILLATVEDQQAAQKEAELYRQRGIDAYWVKVNLGALGIRYRLFTGVFSTVAQAEQFSEESDLIDKPVKPTFYAARVGVYSDKSELADAFVKAGKAEVMPYVLKTPQSEYFLYVGAFYTFIGALDQCRDLTAADLSCTPVKRSTIPPQ